MITQAKDPYLSQCSQTLGQLSLRSVFYTCPWKLVFLAWDSRKAPVALISRLALTDPDS